MAAPGALVRKSVRASTSPRGNSTLPRLSKVMVRFEPQGWIVRHPDPDNGRYTRATLTALGLQKVVESAPAHVVQVKQLVFDPLSRAQQRHLGAALARIAAPIHEQLAAGARRRPGRPSLNELAIDRVPGAIER